MPRRLVPFAIAAGVFALDRVTKVVVERAVSLWDVHVVIPGFFQIIHTQNRGAAFSMLSDASESVRSIVLIGLSMGILAVIASMLWNSASRMSNEHWSMRLGLSIVLGGASGNVFDRVTHGAVTDFLDVFVGDYHWPTFNVADCGITIGAALLLLSLWRGRREDSRLHVSETR